MRRIILLVMATIFVHSLSAQYWKLTGNSGLGSSAYLGTDDATPMLIKVNNQKSGYLHPSITNTSFGYQSLLNVTSKLGNTAFGFQSLKTNTSGSFNTAIGNRTLYYNKTGHSNVAIGVDALYYNKAKSNLVAIGDSALYHNGNGASYYDDATNNTAIGSKTLYTNTIGYNNTATGSYALYYNTNGFGNTANGIYALYFNTTGSLNTATGLGALDGNTTGSSNTANGYEALLANIDGSANAANGAWALHANTSGYENTADGVFALGTNATGSYNTAAGSGSGSNGHSSNYCSFFGYDANRNVADTPLVFNNSTAIGNASRITGSNQVRIGNSSVKSIGGYVGWSNVSDRRVKKDIQENVPGLLFINKLKPVTYHLNVTVASSFLGEDKKNNAVQQKTGANSRLDKSLAERSIKEKEKTVYTGFVAQDVEKVAKEIGYDFSGVDKPDNENTLYGLRYAEFVVPLVKAVQELSDKNDALKHKNDDLEKRLENMEAMMQSLINRQQTNTNSALSLVNASMEQNIPNPFKSATTINYNLPNSFSSAKIIITDNAGKALKEITLSGSGRGSVQVDASMLTSAAYQYSLVIDGKIIASRQMLLNK